MEYKISINKYNILAQDDSTSSLDNQSTVTASETPKNYCSYGEDEGSDSDDDS